MSILDDLVRLSHTLGAPELDAAILGEGNTSARIDAETFRVKGSGCSLGTTTADDFVHLRLATILALMDEDAVDDARLKTVYDSAKVDARQGRRPSVETLLHAVLLQYPGVAVVAHTHPTAINALTVTPQWERHLAGRLFPDEAVVLGRDSVFVPYVDPGMVLAKAIRDAVDAYRIRQREVPKAIYLQNHGFIALAGSPTEAVNITMMAIKAARIRQAAIACGGLRPLPALVVDHLLARPDEKYRQRQLAT